MTLRATLVIAALVVACGKGGEAPAPTGSATGSAIVAGSAGSGVAAGSAAPTAVVSAKVMAARCGEPCLFLVDTTIEDVPAAYKTACNKEIEGYGFEPTPPLVFGMQGEKLSGDAFVKQLYELLEIEIMVNHRLDPDGATLTYAELDSDAADMDFIKALRAALPTDHKSLRAALVDFALPGGGSEENPVSEGVYVLFVYDAKDQLVGLALDHYLFD